jgi:hypothetical protein
MCTKIRDETLGFYEAADFVKTRWKIFSFIFGSFWPTSDNTSPVWLLVLDLAVRGPPSNHNDQTPKPVTASSAQRSWLKRATE